MKIALAFQDAVSFRSRKPRIPSLQTISRHHFLALTALTCAILSADTAVAQLNISLSANAPTNSVISQTSTNDGFSVRFWTNAGVDRDSGQTFTPNLNFLWDSLTLQAEVPPQAGAVNAAISLQLFENLSEIALVAGGVLPNLAANDFVTFDFPDVPVVVGNEYGFLLLFNEEAADRRVDFLSSTSDPYFEGTQIRREFNGARDLGMTPFRVPAEDFVFYINPVPEPSTFALCGLGLALVAGRRRARAV